MSVPITRQILLTIQADILTLTGLAPERVHFLTSIDVDVTDLPDVVLFSIEDKAVDSGTDSAGGQTRAFTFGASVSTASDDEASTDQLAVQVRQVALQDPGQGGLALDTAWDSQEWGSGAGSSATSMTKLTFTTTYYWRPEW